MKKKFDFSAEMNDAESIKITPKNEYLEEEKRLLDVNAKELASLNDNVHEMSINLVNLLKFLQKNKLVITQDTQEQAKKFGQSVLDKFLHQIQDKWDETERKIHLADNYVLIPHWVFYILIIILVALSSFFRQHHSGQYRSFTLRIDLESCYLLYSHSCFGDWNSGNCAEVFG